MYLGGYDNHTWGANASAKRFLFTDSFERVNCTLVGYLYTEVREILIKTGEMQWKTVKTAKKHSITVLRVELSRNWLKQCGFFFRVVAIWGEMMWNNVQMVQLLKDWEKNTEKQNKGNLS